MNALPCLRRAMALCAALSIVAAPALATISFRAERELGKQFDLAARRQLPLITDPEVVAYVDTIGQRIVRQLDDSFFQYQFSVVRDGSVNAFAVPGGYIYVHSGLLLRAASDDEVASVLGHEIAHVHAHHLARQQEATQLMNYASLLGILLAVINPAAAAVATAANATATLKYTREFEQEADLLGVRYMQKAGYDPHAMLDFFKKLADDSRSLPTVPPYLLSHPLTDDRLNHLEAVLRTQQWAKHDRPAASFALRRVQVLARARTEKPADVLAYYQRALDADPKDPQARYFYGVACLETGQVEAAQTALQAARAGGVQAADRELGRLALRQRRLPEARDLLQKSLQAEPKDAGAYVELAKTLEALGDSRGAMDAYQRAWTIAPSLEAAHQGYGMLAGRAGDQAAGLYHLATAARLQGDYEQALTLYARAQPLVKADARETEDVSSWITDLSKFLHVDPPKEGQQPRRRHFGGDFR
jgi:predicted Zn-dependent protease